jgi:2-polyprenyl-6-methoxyphenol hydroxylase-like FAD-dependent oxidoreductase
MMLGYLLARQGVEVVVLEKHKDFLRDFRGDTVHTSTLEALSELGLLDRFLALPHQQYPRFDLSLDGRRYHVLDLKAVPTVCKFVAFMPQWDFLNFLASEAAAYPAFRLLMETEGVGLIRDGKRIVGVRAESKEEKIEIRADLVVACDGRTSRLREEAGLKPREFGIPIDVLWMRLGKRPGMPNEVLGYVDKGRFLVLIDRGDYFQGGYLIPKGGFEGIKAEGLPTFRSKLVVIAPFLAEVIEELADWDQVKLLTVRIDRLEEWAVDGLLCIGDAAHAMSPAGGVGINLAIQDAIAASNFLTKWLQKGRVPLKELRRVQKRRLLPTRVLQWMQRMIHARMVRPGGTANLAFFLRLISRFTPLRALFGRLIAMGPRMEHVDLRSR